jgi:IstB-like ATP binding protein
VANQLKMAKVHTILTLRARGWSFRRIGRELGVHRETAARYARLAETPSTAILDRFLHHAEVITITGRSYRLRNNEQRESPKVRENHYDLPGDNDGGNTFLNQIHMKQVVCILILSLAIPVSAAESHSRTRSDSTSRIIGKLTAMLDERPLLALCENHSSETQHEFLRALIADARFTDRVDDIVVEFASAGRQEIIDRYVKGEDVSLDELAVAWRDIGAVHMPWESPVYSAFFEHIRNINIELAKSGSSRRLRVLGGDPPIDWSKINTFEELVAYYNAPENERDTHMATVIRLEVLDRGRRALLLAGNGHLTRRNLWDPPASHPSPDTTTVHLERERPGSIFVVLYLGRELLEGTKLGKRLVDVRNPQLIPSSDALFDSLPAGIFTTIRRYGASGDRSLAFPGLDVTAIADTVLYLYPSDEHRSSVHGVTFLESIDLTEINRRRTVARQGSVSVEDLLQESAEITLAEGRAAESLPIWRRLVERKPESPEFHAGLAQTFAKLNMTKDAMDSFAVAIKLGEATKIEGVSAWRMMAEKLANQKKPKPSPPGK